MLAPTPLDTPCREWRGRRHPHGYGLIKRSGRNAYIHRLVWALVNGPIPDGMVVMHRCDNPPCFRLDHLQLGTVKDNIVDAANKGRIFNPMVARTHCPKGHPYDETNTIRRRQGWRTCRACERARWRVS